MAMIKCPECGKEVSEHAKTCPNCGYPIDDVDTEDVESAVNEIQTEAAAKHGIGIVCGILMCFISIAYFIFSHFYSELLEYLWLGIVISVLGLFCTVYSIIRISRL